MFTWYNRYKTLKNVDLLDDKANIYFSSNTKFNFCEGAKVSISSGPFTVGYPLPSAPNYPTYEKTLIHIGKNSKIVVLGPVFIAPGVTIRLLENTVLTFSGNNFIGHNSLIMGSKKIYFGENSSISWNVTIMNDDGHRYCIREKLKKLPTMPLILEDHCGIQQNASILRGVSIGRESIVSANTVVRSNVDSKCIVYSEQTVRKKRGVSTGYALATDS